MNEEKKEEKDTNEAHVINSKYNKKSKGKRFKELLSTMVVGTPVKFDHTEFYCIGWGQRCTLNHYTSLLKRKGAGEWKVEHLGPGQAVVLRIQ